MSDPLRLLPCPFCEKDKASYGRVGCDTFEVICGACGAAGPICPGREAAAAAWNGRAAPPAPALDGWQATHQHYKGGLYRVVGHALDVNAVEAFPSIIYENERGERFVQHASRFNDGRFTPLPPPPKQEG